MPDRKHLPSIAEAQRTPLVEQLLEQIEELLEENRRQAEQIQQLRAWGIDISVGQIAMPCSAVPTMRFWRKRTM
jgi:hypothetical protein